MNVVIRTDASLEIGTGHVMRCITFAKQLKREGANITFVCRNFNGNSISFLQNQGFKVFPLNSPILQNHWKWIRENWEQDARETRLIIENLNGRTHLLIVDHYGLDAKWESCLRLYVNRIMVIDDLADRVHDCDLLLDQNYYLNMEKRYNGLVSDSCIQLLGPNYALLRDEFLSIDISRIRQRERNVKNILVIFGGTDPTGETVKTLHAIQELNRLDIEFNIVVGAANPQKDKIECMCNKLPNLIYHCQVTNISELMLNADFSIGAGGSTTWERCFLKLPSIIVIVADNQREIVDAVEKKGVAICLGESNQITDHHLKEEILNLLESPDKIVEMSCNCSAVIDPQLLKRNETVKRLMSLIYMN